MMDSSLAHTEVKAHASKEKQPEKPRENQPGTYVWISSAGDPCPEKMGHPHSQWLNFSCFYEGCPSVIRTASRSAHIAK